MVIALKYKLIEVGLDEDAAENEAEYEKEMGIDR
jgi:hypothetical protein